MTRGEKVEVRLYGGDVAVRRVLAVRESTIVICAEEEYENAAQEGRDAVGLGFPKEDVLELAAQ